jgi:hypothetical protein
VLDLRSEPLSISETSSIVRDGDTIKTMLITVHTPRFLTETANAASVLPCPDSFDGKRPVGYDLALAGRCAR